MTSDAGMTALLRRLLQPQSTSLHLLLPTPSPLTSPHSCIKFICTIILAETYDTINFYRMLSVGLRLRPLSVVREAVVSRMGLSVSWWAWQGGAREGELAMRKGERYMSVLV